MDGSKLELTYRVISQDIAIARLSDNGNLNILKKQPADLNKQVCMAMRKLLETRNNEVEFSDGGRLVYYPPGADTHAPE